MWLGPGIVFLASGWTVLGRGQGGIVSEAIYAITLVARSVVCPKGYVYRRR